MNLVLVYHIYAGGRWQEPLDEWLSAVAESGFDGTIFYGVVGPRLERPEVWRRCIDFRGRVAIEADTGNEFVTLNWLRGFVKRFDGAVLYAHTKGAHEHSEFRARWRRSMTARLLGRWRENLALLSEGNVDAVGSHWLTEDRYPGMFAPAMTVPASGSGFFGGNYWMATTSYLRRLPLVEPEPRWEAEQWIGINHPRVVDLLPGWPHDRCWPELCH